MFFSYAQWSFFGYLKKLYLDLVDHIRYYDQNFNGKSFWRLVRANMHPWPIPILATFSNISGRPKNIGGKLHQNRARKGLLR